MGVLSRAVTCAVFLMAAAPAADLASLGYPAEAVATDREGNVYLAGTTRTANLRVVNAFQPQPGESQFLRSDDGGVTWTRAGSLDSDPPTALAADPFTPGLLYAGSLQGIYKSGDGGRTWRLVLRTPETRRVAEIVPDPAVAGRLFAAAESMGLLRSDDAGETWTTVLDYQEPLSTLARTVIDPHGSGTVLTTAGLAMQISRDAGGTWELLRSPSGSLGSPRLAVFDPHGRGRIYLATSAGTLGQFYVSDDYGETWQERTNPPSGAISFDLKLDPERPDVLYAVAFARFHRSEDGGRTWNTVEAFPAPGPFALLPRGCEASGVLVSVNGPLRSADGGDTWTPLGVNGVALATSGAGCTFWIGRGMAGEAFVAKVNADGEPVWATYLGGAGQDALRRIAVDAQGNVTATGTTQSPDFPGTLHGTRAFADVFVTRFDRDGALVCSTVLAGSGFESAASLAVDADGGALVAGTTSSPDFPFTAGAVEESGGFVFRLDAGGRLTYATPVEAPRFEYVLGLIETPISAVPAEAGGAWVTGHGGRLLALDRGGAVIETRQLCEACTAHVLATGRDGSLYVAGYSSAPAFPATPGTYDTGVRSGGCMLGNRYTIGPGDLFVMKFLPGAAAPEFSAIIGADCRTIPEAMAVDEEGRIAIAATTLAAAFPLRRPLYGSSRANIFTGVVLQLAPGARDLLFSTYRTDANPAPAIAPGPGDSIYIGTQLVDLSPPAGPRLDRVLHAFRGTATVSPGGLVMLTGAGLGPEDWHDMGLNAREHLPAELGGTAVLFNGQPAPVLFSSPGKVVCVAPLRLGWPTLVEVRYNGAVSNAVPMQVLQQAGLLTSLYPSRPPYDASMPPPQGSVQNEDGTWNSQDNPARPGSRMRVFLTGMGPPGSAPEPGSIAADDAIVEQAWGFWQHIGRTQGAPVRLVPGFVTALQHAVFEAPAPPAETAGGPLTFRMYSFNPNFPAPPPPDSNPISVWVR